MRIHDFASAGDCGAVQVELRNGVSVDARDERDYTPLACALSNIDSDEQMLRLLISSGADVNAGIEGSKYFPIGLAACSGSLSNVQRLLDTGAIVNFVSPEGYTVLVNIMYALRDNMKLIPVADLLVKNGPIIDCETRYGESPLIVASIQGRFDAVK